MKSFHAKKELLLSVNNKNVYVNFKMLCSLTAIESSKLKKRFRLNAIFVAFILSGTTKAEATPSIT